MERICVPSEHPCVPTGAEWDAIAIQMPQTSLEQGVICVPYKEIIEEMIASKCQQGISNTWRLVFTQNV